MADSTAYNRDNEANRRADVAAWFHSIGQMIEHDDVPFEQIEPFVDTAINNAVAKYDRMRADEHEAAFHDLEASLAAHTCGSGDWCYVCTVQHAQGEGWRT